MIKIEDCFNKEFLSLRALNIESQFEVKRFLSNEIIEVNKFLNVGEPMSIRQIELTCNLVLREFLDLNIADIRLCFEMGMAGKFGKLYNRIDGQIILEWLRAYREERFEAAEVLAQQVNDKQKDWLKSGKPDAVKMYEDYKNNQQAEKEKDDAEVEKRRAQAIFNAAYSEAMFEFNSLPIEDKTPAKRTELLKKYKVI